MLRKDGDTNQGSQQNQRKTNLAMSRKTKLLTQKRNLKSRYAKTQKRRHRTRDLNKAAQNQSDKVEKNKTTDT